AIAPASQGAPKAKAALDFTASPYWIKLPRLPCCVHVARSCRQWLGIVETKGELFATSATRQREVSPAKYPICWQLSQDYHLSSSDKMTDYRDGCVVGLHSCASFCASAICSGVIRRAIRSRKAAAPSLPWDADNSNHMYDLIRSCGTPRPLS